MRFDIIEFNKKSNSLCNDLDNIVVDDHFRSSKH